MKFTIPDPPYTGPPLPFAVNERRVVTVDLNGVQVLDIDDPETPVHPEVTLYQAERAWQELWNPPVVLRPMTGAAL